MVINYASKKLKKSLESEKAIKINYGTLAVRIMARLSEFEFADTLDEIPCYPPPRREKLSDGRYSVMLNGNWRIVFSAVNGFEPSNISEICIEGIVDYH